MPRLLFPDVNLKKQHRGYRKHDREMKCAGIDTETFRGTCRLICDSWGRVCEPRDITEALDFLAYKDLRGTNFFFNISYDFTGIIKLFPEETIKELYENQKITWEGYQIHYLDGKYFKIRKDKHTNTFYDLNNFLETSLEHAASKYLGEHKINTVESARLNTDLNYWNDHRDEIIRYCLQDAVLVKHLAEWYFSLIRKTLGFNPIKPYSQGALAQEYFLKKSRIPTINNIPYGVLEHAYYSYAGGRFELLQRGYFESVSIYDIKSAYPSVLAGCPDFTRGHFRFNYSIDELHPDIIFGWYLCRVMGYHRHLSPFLKKNHGVNIYPNGEYWVYLTLSEIRFIQKYFPKTVIEVHEGWYWVPPINTRTFIPDDESRNVRSYPLSKEIMKLYNLKEQETDPEKRQIYKVPLNAAYGKTIQVNPDGGIGQLFNPLWASECTAQTRIKLMKFALQAGVENVIGFSTDSIHLSRDYNLPGRKEIGMWDLDFNGEGVYLFTDIYSVWNKDRKKDVFRGMVQEQDEQGNKKFIRLRELLERMGRKRKLEYAVSRPIHLGEALTNSNYTIKDVNVWHDTPKTFNINGDRKRAWETEFSNAWECLEENHSSEPLLLEM